MLSTPIQHVLLTRYNLPMGTGVVHLDSGWLDERFQLFAKYCAPSVKNQTDQNFTWLILLDRRTPSVHLSALERVIPDNGRTVLFDKPLNDTPAAEWLQAAGLSPERPLLTTRLDNDDSLRRDFIATIATHGENSDEMPVVFNFPVGQQLALNRLYWVIDPSNAFISLLEPPGSTRTILSVGHPEASTLGPIRQIYRGPMWLQVVHGGNVANEVRGVRLGHLGSIRRFGVDCAELSRPTDSFWFTVREFARTAYVFLRSGVRRQVRNIS